MCIAGMSFFRLAACGSNRIEGLLQHPACVEAMHMASSRRGEGEFRPSTVSLKFDARAVSVSLGTNETTRVVARKVGNEWVHPGDEEESGLAEVEVTQQSGDDSSSTHLSTAAALKAELEEAQALCESRQTVIERLEHTVKELESEAKSLQSRLEASEDEGKTMRVRLHENSCTIATLQASKNEADVEIARLLCEAEG